MMHEENYENKGICMHCGCGCMHCNCNAAGPMKKEFKLAMLEKKEKHIKTELEFIGKMKELINKMPERKE
jgi:hypothetical protein